MLVAKLQKLYSPFFIVSAQQHSTAVLICFFLSSKKQGTSKTITAYKKGSSSAIEPSIDVSYCKWLSLYLVPFIPNWTSETALMT